MMQLINAQYPSTSVSGYMSNSITPNLLSQNTTLPNIIQNILLLEFYERVPYLQDLNILTQRILGIVNKYTINLLNYAIKMQQLNNYYNLLSQNLSKTIDTSTNLTSSINTTNTTNTAQADAFNPVDNSNINIDLSTASSTATVTADGVSTASSSNSNFDTKQNQTQTTSHNTKESDIAIYATIKFECDNLIQPVLTALNSLFYVFDVGEENDYYSL